MSGKFKPAPLDENKVWQTSLKVGHKGKGMRLDRFLARYMKSYSRTEIQEFIRKGLIFVNGQHKRMAFSLSLNDDIFFSVPQKLPFHLIPEALPLDIIYEDNWFIVVNKKANVSVHPASGNVSGTIMNALAFHFKNQHITPAPVHRLDSDVTGALIIAKTKIAKVKLSELFAKRVITKLYLGVVSNKMKNSEGIINEPLPLIASSSIEKKIAVTRYIVLQQYKSHALVLFKPLTGRKHQIRQHANIIGNPLEGDEKYGAKSELIARPALHAYRILFIHPITSIPFSVKVSLPNDLKTLCKNLAKRMK